MGVRSDGSYGVDAELYYSFPVTVDSSASGGGGDAGGRGTCNIVSGLHLDTDTTTHIAQTTKTLRAELDKALAIDDEMPPVVFDDAPVAEFDSAAVTLTA